jgi:hypothetical protein
MLEFYEPGAAIIEDSVAKTVARWNKTNQYILNFMFGAQKAMFEEVMFAGPRCDRNAPVRRILLEDGRRAFGRRPENDVSGMRSAPDRLCPPR